ncbi:MAG: hypothetical protein AB7P34_00120 [Vicinamibacterales bacterium]
MTHFRPAYLVAANTALLLWLLQIVACVGLRTYDHVMPALLSPPMSEAVQRNYAHMTAADRSELLATMRRLQFRYEPVIGIQQQQITSRFVNVNAHGIRSNGHAAESIASLDGSIWFLGGSTSFGYGIADSETIPAQLERLIGQPVVNLGVPTFSTIQENLLLNHYLRIGYRPSRVLFLDGINEACNTFPYRRELSNLFDRAQRGYDWDIGGPVLMAYFRAVRKVQKLAGTWVDEGDLQSVACATDGKQYPFAEIHARLLAERDAICRVYDVDCRTLVQPFAGVHGRTDELPQSFLEGDGKDVRKVFFHLEPSWRAAGAIFITDAFDGYDRHPFIDEIHYSADASGLIAKMIAKRLGLGGAVTPAP